MGNNPFEIFKNNGKTIFKKRNEIKIIGNNSYKMFKVPNFFNRIIYTFFRKSKAERSYLNGLKLMKIGISTPQPKAFYLENKNSLIYRSIYISSYIKNYFEIRDVFKLKISNRETILKELGKFIFQLHKKNVFHKDLSAGNILIQKINNNYYNYNYKFYLIDINRLEFKKLSFKSKAQNFAKLSTSDLDLKTIITSYCKLSNLNYNQFLSLVLKYRQKEKTFRKFKAFIKRI